MSGKPGGFNDQVNVQRRNRAIPNRGAELSVALKARFPEPSLSTAQLEDHGDHCVDLDRFTIQEGLTVTPPFNGLYRGLY